VLDGDPAPHGKGHSTPPKKTGHVYCGQTVGHLSNCWALVKTCEQRDIWPTDSDRL